MLERVERNLQGLPQNDYQWGRNILYKFLQQARGFESMPTSLSRNLLRSARQKMNFQSLCLEMSLEKSRRIQKTC